MATLSATASQGSASIDTDTKAQFLYDRCLTTVENDHDLSSSLDHLERFPREIRDLMLEFVLFVGSRKDTTGTVMHVGSPKDLKVSTCPGILRTSRRLYVEASQVLFRTNQFSMHTYSDRGPPRYHWSWFPETRKFHVFLKCGFDFKEFTSENHCRGDGPIKDKNFTTSFNHKLVSPKLLYLIRHLKIYIGIKFCFQYDIDIILKLPRKTGILLPIDQAKTHQQYISEVAEVISKCQRLETLEMRIVYLSGPIDTTKAFTQCLERLARPVGAKNIKISSWMRFRGNKHWQQEIYTLSPELQEYLTSSLSKNKGSEVADFTGDYLAETKEGLSGFPLSDWAYG